MDEIYNMVKSRVEKVHFLLSLLGQNNQKYSPENLQQYYNEFRKAKEEDKYRIEKENWIINTLKKMIKELTVEQQLVIYVRSKDIMNILVPSFSYNLNSDLLKMNAKEFIEELTQLYMYFMNLFQKTEDFKLKLHHNLKMPGQHIVPEMLKYLVEFSRDYFKKFMSYHSKQLQQQHLQNSIYFKDTISFTAKDEQEVGQQAQKYTCLLKKDLTEITQQQNNINNQYECGSQTIDQDINIIQSYIQHSSPKWSYKYIPKPLPIPQYESQNSLNNQIAQPIPQANLINNNVTLKNNSFQLIITTSKIIVSGNKKGMQTKKLEYKASANSAASVGKMRQAIFELDYIYQQEWLQKVRRVSGNQQSPEFVVLKTTLLDNLTQRNQEILASINEYALSFKQCIGELPQMWIQQRTSALNIERIKHNLCQRPLVNEESEGSIIEQDIYRPQLTQPSQSDQEPLNYIAQLIEKQQRRLTEVEDSRKATITRQFTERSNGSNKQVSPAVGKKQNRVHSQHESITHTNRAMQIPQSQSKLITQNNHQSKLQQQSRLYQQQIINMEKELAKTAANSITLGIGNNNKQNSQNLKKLVQTKIIKVNYYTRCGSSLLKTQSDIPGLSIDQTLNGQHCMQRQQQLHQQHLQQQQQQLQGLQNLAAANNNYNRGFLKYNYWQYQQKIRQRNQSNHFANPMVNTSQAYGSIGSNVNSKNQQKSFEEIKDTRQIIYINNIHCGQEDTSSPQFHQNQQQQQGVGDKQLNAPSRTSSTVMAANKKKKSTSFTDRLLTESAMQERRSNIQKSNQIVLPFSHDQHEFIYGKESFKLSQTLLPKNNNDLLKSSIMFPNLGNNNNQQRKDIRKHSYDTYGYNCPVFYGNSGGRGGGSSGGRSGGSSQNHKGIITNGNNIDDRLESDNNLYSSNISIEKDMKSSQRLEIPEDPSMVTNCITQGSNNGSKTGKIRLIQQYTNYLKRQLYKGEQQIDKNAEAIFQTLNYNPSQ